MKTYYVCFVKEGSVIFQNKFAHTDAVGENIPYGIKDYLAENSDIKHHEIVLISIFAL